MTDDKGAETPKEPAPEVKSGSEDILSLVDKITNDIVEEDKNKVNKDDVYTKDQVSEIVKEVLKKNLETKSETESTKEQLNTLKSEQEQKLQAIDEKLSKIDKQDSGSKVTTPVESDPHSLGEKKLGLTEKLGSHEKRQDGHSDATEEYSKRTLLKWGVIRERK